jgi:hypothetical protein
MDRRSPAARKAAPLPESDYIQKKNGEISRIVTDTDLMKDLGLHDEQDYHDARSAAIIKILNRLDDFYLEINALY